MPSEFVVFGENGKLVKISQEGYEKENMFPEDNEFGKRRGGDKVPFAFNYKGEEISVEDAEKYFFSSKYYVLEKPVKLKRDLKYIRSSIMGQLFYLKEQEDSTKQILNIIERALCITFSVIFVPAPTYICPSCNGELKFYNIKKDRKSDISNYFRHKEPFPVLYRITEEVVQKAKTFKAYLSFEEKLKALEPLLNIDFTKNELTTKLGEIKIIKDDKEDRVVPVELSRILPYVHRVYKGHCDFIYETEKHLRAKWRIAEVIKNGNNILLLRRCSACKNIAGQSLSVENKKVSFDYVLSSEHRADVAIVDSEEKLLAVIEVTDEIEVDSYKEKALKDIHWIELSAETVLGSDQWLVKRDYFKPLLCKECRKKDEDIFPDTIPETPVKIEPPGEGRVKIESENYFFYLNLLLKEEFRISNEMIEVAVKELDKFFGFKTTEIAAFNKNGTKKIVYKYDYSEKLPPDKDTMWVLSFKVNEKHWINILDHYQPIPNQPGYVKCVIFADAMPEKGKGIFYKGIHPVNITDIRVKFLSLLSRFFYVKNTEKIDSLIYVKSEFKKSASNKYRKQQNKTYNYSMPHQDAYGSEIEKMLGEAMEKENIKFTKQYEIYLNKKLCTVPDFYIESGNIVIYCDGFKYHYNKEDVIKDRFQDRELQYLGYRVMRFIGSEIKGNIEQCIYDIKRFMKKFSRGS